MGESQTEKLMGRPTSKILGLSWEICALYFYSGFPF